MPLVVDVETTTPEPFDPAARIICIGLKELGGEATVLFDPDERSLLEQFWERTASHQRVIGFNFDFDERWLVLRSLKHGVPIKPLDVLDLRTVLGLGDRRATGKLAEFAELIGAGKGPFGGNEVPLLWSLGKTDEILAYNRNDLAITEQLYERMKAIGLL